MFMRDSKWALFLIILLLLGSLTYIVLPKLQIETTSLKVDKNVLYEKIRHAARKYGSPPENAYIDRVWKKTPGRNGRKVNIEASYQKMKKQGRYRDNLLVFDKVPPSISLDMLPPAPIYRGHPEKQMVALIINVSSGESYIPSILKTLKNENVKVTFFVEGKWATEHQNLVRMIDEQHHLIGNHGYKHPDLTTLSTAQTEEQISKTNAILSAITDKEPRYFAPPNGVFQPSTVQIADRLDMQTIMWSVDTIDWRNPSVSVMMKRVNDNIHPGAIILMHPTIPVRDGLSEMIHEFKSSGYDMDTVANLLDEER